MGGVFGILISAFLSAALVEEVLKYFMVKCFVFQKPYFDEVFDGIVYAVTASLGFATLENIMYVMLDENPYSVGILRALTAVPSHAFDGALLGYFLGLAKFSTSPIEQKRFIKKGLTYAILFHGFYDFFLFSGVLFFLVIPLLLFQFFMVRRALWQALQKNPPKKLYQNMVAGLSLGDFIKLFFGTLCAFATLFGALVLVFALFSPIGETADPISLDVAMVLVVFFVFWGVVAFLLFHSVWKRKIKYNREVLKEDRLNLTHLIKKEVQKMPN